MCKMSTTLWFFLIITLLFSACSDKFNTADLDEYSRDQLDVWHYKLTEVIVKDIFTPPVASRIYAYGHLSAYEVLSQFDESMDSFHQYLDGLEALPAPKPSDKIYGPLAANLTLSYVSRQLVVNEDLLVQHEAVYIDELRSKGLPEAFIEDSKAYAALAAEHFMAYIRKDNYLETRSMPRYMVNETPGRWVPTPPPYMEAIEPHWERIRAFALDSASQFPAGPPYAFETNEGSALIEECKEIMEVVKGLDKEKVEIANFWDCNPNQTYNVGHVMLFKQKLSPGGHWLGIASIANRKINAPLGERARNFALLAMGLHDAFIAAWQAKYHYNYIRPVTVIRDHLNPTWEPLLETPAFPEHTSGHSVVSAASSVILTKLFGDNFYFEDTSEVDYGLPIRNYNSFQEAAEEAAISRFYGGIHFMPSINEGVKQGRKVGQKILDTFF